MVVQESLVAMAAADVRQLIVTGQLPPGARVHEPPLAEQLEISRPPLREALRILESEGLLKQTPRRGYRVVEMTDRDVEEIYSLRRTLELFALDLIVANYDATVFAPLDEVMDRMREAAAANDHPGVVQANVDFHLGVVAATGHSRLLDSYRALMGQMQVSMAANLATEAKSAGDLARGCERHERLLASLRSGDKERIIKDFDEHGERDYLNRTR
ncbi:GntR family transcriptional regulator [Nocardia camponoti]|uniref:GntR family transcriptional regulator n=1 Tax=Nocardia camponoti TaxID=1616106 RepID=A0A917QBQ2_9NOCA|nr:GntR family transcriptional regulator [Nocardia camponoti]GGK42050.1 GntR family transcriptional regulator [Nocardia camponoti]